MTENRTPFHDLAEYMAIPRVGSLKLSPDGSWLAATVQTLSPDKKKYLTSIWRIDPQGGPASRLTRSAEGEGSPGFLPDGELLFISRRRDPEDTAKDAEPRAALWQLPAAGGEARLRTSLPGGIAAIATPSPGPAAPASPGPGAPASAGPGTAVVSAQVLPAAATPEQDEQRRKQRKDAGVTAILHEAAPIRYWDHDLGPAQLRLFALAGQVPDQVTDLTPEPGRALDEQEFALTPDGTAIITGWRRRISAADDHVELVRIDVATGERTTLLSDQDCNFESPAISPDGRQVVCLASTRDTSEVFGTTTMVLADASAPGQTPRDLLLTLDRRPAEAIWARDGSAVYFTADDDGRCPIFKVDVATGETVKLTTAGAHTSLSADPEGRYLFALRATIDQPLTPVRIDLATGTATSLPCPGTDLTVPGHVEEIETTADDGERIRSWLVLPEDTAQPVPLLLWVHGGPHSSWNAWSWRWNPWLLAARGYAVLLPDPSLSTGYGQHMIQRGHHNWGQRTFDDVMAITEVALARPDIDETRIAMMGGSYGGYMANWIAGHTDRFRAIVSHASLWALDQMFSTTDGPSFWLGQWGDALDNPDVYQANTPHLHIKNIRTPMLIVHGDKDYRVPIGEALRLWDALTRHGVDAKFLYYPDENHWVLTPGNATVWYETVYAFLAQHVLDQPWERPELL
jgi:dipeptidyl aminopeptidase/acylaminoacyl peptidase